MGFPISEEEHIKQVHTRIGQVLGGQRECTVSITGLRPHKLPARLDVPALQEAIRLQIAVCRYVGYRNFLCGLAQGTDLWAAEVITELREQDPDIRLYTFQPCAEQTRNWDEFWRMKHKWVLEEADENFLLRHAHTPACMRERNELMVHHAACLIAVHDHQQHHRLRAQASGKRL